jgi:hypothetical protein
MTDTATKTRENRARRAARRRGLRLSKSRTRDTGGSDFGLYGLFLDGKAVNPPLLPGKFKHSWTIDQVEDYLAGHKRK